MRSCHTCRNQELCFLRKHAERLIYFGMGMLYDAGKDKDGVTKHVTAIPGDTEGIYKAIAECCMKYEMEVKENETP